MIVIIDYNSGNIKSVSNALSRLGCDFVVTSDPGIILNADKVIFPGVGRASQAMSELESRGLVDVIKSITSPCLGICLGMQLLFDSSEEDSTRCLEIIPGTVCMLPKNKVTVPNIGWSEVASNGEGLFQDIDNNAPFYFVHSYYCETLPAYTIGMTTYGVRFASAVKYKNFYGVQFHPEKSGRDGEQLLRNFVNL